ncbi:hypothetical protein C0995_002241 [Termitomyces sp. Mi166|nr:hypothetical protein C0995_002241 [Termitomyces sp. Mi166\
MAFPMMQTKHEPRLKKAWVGRSLRPQFFMMPDFDDLLLECVLAQRRTSELLVYSTSAKQLVKIVWPAHNGVVIEPSGILKTNSKANPENCGLDVYCHSYGLRGDCGFHLDLVEKYKTVTLFSPYIEIPTLARRLYVITKGEVTPRVALAPFYAPPKSIPMSDTPKFDGILDKLTRSLHSIPFT